VGVDVGLLCPLLALLNSTIPGLITGRCELCGVWTYGIPGIDTNIICVLQERKSLCLVQNPGLPFSATVAHSTQNNLGDLKSGLA
jgi:hypothetical protein